MPADPIHHLRHDLLAVAMRDLRYSIEAIDHAIERAAIYQADGMDWNEANVAAVREVDAWPEERRLHQVPAAATPATAEAA